MGAEVEELERQADVVLQPGKEGAWETRGSAELSHLLAAVAAIKRSLKEGTTQLRSAGSQLSDLNLKKKDGLKVRYWAA